MNKGKSTFYRDENRTVDTDSWLPTPTPPLHHSTTSYWNNRLKEIKYLRAGTFLKKGLKGLIWYGRFMEVVRKFKSATLEFLVLSPAVPNPIPLFPLNEPSLQSLFQSPLSIPNFQSLFTWGNVFLSLSLSLSPLVQQYKLAFISSSPYLYSPFPHSYSSTAVSYFHSIQPLSLLFPFLSSV